MRIAIPFGFLLAALLGACQSPAPGTTTVADSTMALQAPYSPVFYDSLSQVVAAYYRLSDALVKADSGKATQAAAELKFHIDSLPVQTLQMDADRLSQVTANTGSISAELTGLAGENSLEGKRAAFQMVSDILFDVLQTTGLKGQTIYRQYCPMAFNDKGAYWLSNKTEILNPYFGDKMLHCGDVTDTLMYK